MLPRKCKFCERRFVKTEHLKRHQRSHTGEKPYKCIECAKSFSRSDVLSRHVKAHPQQDVIIATPDATIDEDDEETRSICEQETGEMQEQWATEHQLDRDEIRIAEVIIESSILPPMESQSSHVLPNHRPTIPTTHQDINPLSRAGLNDPQEHFSESSNQQPNWSDQDMEMAGLLLQTPGSYPSDISGIRSINRLDQCTSVNQLSVGEGNNCLGGDANLREIYGSSRPWLTPGDAGFAIPDEFQFWLNSLDRNPQAGPSDVLFSSQATMMPDLPINGASPQDSAGQSHTSSESLGFVDSTVPKEHFLRVEQCWPHKSAGRRRMMHTLWRDLCQNTSDNLFSGPIGLSERVDKPSINHSRRGLDDEVRNRLEKVFGRPHIIQDARNGSVDSGGSRSEYSDPEQRTFRSFSNSAKFPPAEILDMGLDLYLRHFNPLYPFIHLPTFHPKTTNSSLLHAMCLIGLTLINSRGANNFVNREFNTIFEVVEAELSSYTVNAKARANQVLTTLASGILVGALAEILGGRIDQGKIDQSRMQRLYVQILTQCHEQRLLAVGDSEPLNDATFESCQDLDHRWRAWSRVESAKRLITTMIIVDTWHAGTKNNCPILRTDNLQFLLPCDTALFQCKSAASWLDLLNKGHQLFMPMVTLSARHANIPRIAAPVDSLGMCGMLSVVRLRIYEDYHRLISGCEDDTTETSIVPWQTFATDPQAQITQGLVVEVMEVYGDMLGQMNHNCTALWHSTCITLTADLRTFELGAGCAGPTFARRALGKIATWTQTRSARRAILHAAQIFKIVSGRRVSDGDPFHLCHGLFHSALVLALYIFMIPQKENEDSGPSFELLDEVDWRRVGREGIAFGTDYVDEPAVNFINAGGSISLDGVVHHGGYQSARRILVDFVQLLDEVGKWRAGRYTQILRIMSDALVDDDVLEFHS